MSRHVRRSLSFVLAFGLAALPVFAVPRETPAARLTSAPSPRTSQSVLARLVSLVEKAGSYIDPFGGQPTILPQPPRPAVSTTSNAGSYIDPFGGH